MTDTGKKTVQGNSFWFIHEVYEIFRSVIFQKLNDRAPIFHRLLSSSAWKYAEGEIHSYLRGVRYCCGKKLLSHGDKEFHHHHAHDVTTCVSPHITGEGGRRLG